MSGVSRPVPALETGLREPGGTRLITCSGSRRPPRGARGLTGDRWRPLLAARNARTVGMEQVSLRERDRRESFERRITRPHFHVKPLDDSQLHAWSEYLDFEEAQSEGEHAVGRGPGMSSGTGPRSARKSGLPAKGDGENGGGGRKKGERDDEGARSGREDGIGGERRKRSEVERLYERCLVPCASYWWLWERYALWKVRGGCDRLLPRDVDELRLSAGSGRPAPASVSLACNAAHEPVRRRCPGYDEGARVSLFCCCSCPPASSVEGTTLGTLSYLLGDHREGEHRISGLAPWKPLCCVRVLPVLPWWEAGEPSCVTCLGGEDHLRGPGVPLVFLFPCPPPTFLLWGVNVVRPGAFLVRACPFPFREFDGLGTPAPAPSPRRVQ